MTNLGKNDVPTAVRATNPGWRDPRLWVGVALVAGSVLAGARLLGSADDAVRVWAVAGDLRAGESLTADDLVPAEVGFAVADDVARYLPADQPVPADATLRRDVGAGELLPRAALGPADGSGLQELTIDLGTGGGGLARGDVVDVWAVGDDGATTRKDGAEVVLDDVAVLAVSGGADGFAGSSARQVTVGVRADVELGPAVAAAHAGEVFLVEQGG